jgi:2-oxoglutarate ferredoxin oxidoreductase subunit alpha
MAKVDLSIAIGGAAGQGIATPGDILARIFVRRGLHLNAYNAYQSIVRGGHIFLTLRAATSGAQLRRQDRYHMPLNQDTMDRHLRLMKAGSIVLYSSDKIKAHGAPWVRLCAFSVRSRA